MGGSVIFSSISPVSWSSKHHRGIIALSKTEAEYIQLALTAREILWMHPIFVELGILSIESTLHHICGISTKFMPARQPQPTVHIIRKAWK